jgi:hypothetical protein
MTATLVTGLQNSTITAFNTISTTVQNVAALNATRSKLTFHNPGSVDIVVFPLTAYAGLPQPGGSSSALAPTTAALGGGFRIFANGGEKVLSGQAAKQAWQALSISASNNPLTVMEET